MLETILFLSCWICIGYWFLFTLVPRPGLLEAAVALEHRSPSPTFTLSTRWHHRSCVPLPGAGAVSVAYVTWWRDGCIEKRTTRWLISIIPRSTMHRLSFDLRSTFVRPSFDLHTSPYIHLLLGTITHIVPTPFQAPLLLLLCILATVICYHNALTFIRPSLDLLSTLRRTICFNN